MRRSAEAWEEDMEMPIHIYFQSHLSKLFHLGRCVLSVTYMHGLRGGNSHMLGTCKCALAIGSKRQEDPGLKAGQVEKCFLCENWKLSKLKILKFSHQFL